jgi:hypothetical protein
MRWSSKVACEKRLISLVETTSGDDLTGPFAPISARISSFTS